MGDLHRSMRAGRSEGRKSYHVTLSGRSVTEELKVDAASAGPRGTFLRDTGGTHPEKPEHRAARDARCANDGAREGAAGNIGRLGFLRRRAMKSFPIPGERNGRSHRLVAALCAFLVLAAATNALLFTYHSANPLLVSDNWFYLERIVYPYAHDQLELADLLVKRSVFDHSQPLRRLLLLLNYEWFDLDFRVEALFGAMIGVLNLLVIALLGRRELREGMPLSGWAFATLAAIYLSLSATVVFTWSLLTLAFTSHLVLFVWLASLWRALQMPRGRGLLLPVVLTFLMGLVADDTGLLASIAAAMTLLLHGHRERQWKPSLAVIVAVAAGWLAYSAFYRIVAPEIPSATALHGPGAMQGLLASWPDAWNFMVVPMGSALIHRSTLRPWAGDHAEMVVAVVAVLFALAHLWFWRQAFTGSRNRPAFVAVALMLLFYGLVAALLVGRISARGADYLWQPRYAMAFRWHIVALLLMLLAQSPRWVAAGGWIRRALVAAPLLVLLSVQVAVSTVAWQHAVYSRRWMERAAEQIVALGNDPLHAPKACVPQLTVCRFPADARARLLGFLHDNDLNVFSPQVQRRNALAPVD